MTRSRGVRSFEASTTPTPTRTAPATIAARARPVLCTSSIPRFLPSPLERFERLLGPDDRRARIFEAVQECQVGEEVKVAIDRPLDLLELRELFLGQPLPLGDLLSQRPGVGIRAEEQLEQEPVTRYPADRFVGVQPFAQHPTAKRGQAIKLLVGPGRLLDGRALSEAPLDKTGQDRVDPALRRTPEVADTAPRQPVELVAGSLTERQQ